MIDEGKKLLDQLFNLDKLLDKIVPFPELPEGRTDVGLCLFNSFAIGEWQNKLYNLVLQEDWSTAKNTLEGIVKRVQDLEKCGTDTRRSKFVLNKIREAIDQKNRFVAEQLISEHDNEILAAIETTRGVKIYKRK